MSEFRLKPKAERDTKTGINTDAARLKRSNYSASMRSLERDNQLIYRRRHNHNSASNEGDPNGSDPASPTSPSSPTTLNIDDVLLDIPRIDDLAAALQSTEIDVVTDSIHRLSALSTISAEVCAAIQQTGIAQLLVNMVQNLSLPPVIIIDVSSLITNLMAYLGDIAVDFVRYGLVPTLVQYLELPQSPQNNIICENVVLSIAHIARFNLELRDDLLQHNALVNLVAVAHLPLRLYSLRHVAETISLLCRKPTPPLEFTMVAIPTLGNMLTFKDDDIMVDAAAALGAISSHVPTESALDHMIRLSSLHNAKVIPRLVTLLGHQPTQRAALLAIGNIAVGDETHVNAILLAGGIAQLLRNLQSNDARVREHCAWILSNLAAGSLEQVQSLYDNHVFTMLYGPFQSADAKTRCHILWTLFNAVSHEDAPILNAIATQGWLSVISNCLNTTTDEETLMVSLDILYHFLSYGHKHKLPHTQGGVIIYVNVYAHIFTHGAGQDRLLGLLNSTHDLIQKKSSNLLVRFLNFKSEEIENAADHVGDNDGMGDEVSNVTYDADGNPITSTDGQFDDDDLTFDAEEINQHTVFDL